jgi:Carboxypeptidase regulatory-like domain
LKLIEVKSAVHVTDSASDADVTQPTPTVSIGESALRNSSNVDERFASLPPLVPDVVRRPDGRVNLQGTRDSQSGMLVASANAAEPATGSSAKNVPIDVASSVHAISTVDHTVSMAQAQLCQIMGTVVDVRGDPIPGATVVLAHPGFPHRRTLSTDENGFFEIDDVQPRVSSQIVVRATGFDDWKSPALALQPGQVMPLGGISLKLAAQNTTVTVRYNRAQAATEQIKAEEAQRVFGIFPNFYVSYEGEDAAPMTAKMKFQLALKATYDPVTIAGAALWAGIRQASDTPNYQQGWKGYGERFGAVSADGFIHTMIGDAILQSVLHEDPRYFYKGTGTTKSRLWHAIASSFWSRRDNGSWGPNYSSIGGDLASCALSNLYYPKSNRGAGLVFSQFAISTGERVAVSVAEEFILSKFTHRGGHGKHNDPTQ